MNIVFKTNISTNPKAPLMNQIHCPPLISIIFKSILPTSKFPLPLLAHSSINSSFCDEGEAEEREKTGREPLYKVTLRETC